MDLDLPSIPHDEASMLLKPFSSADVLNTLSSMPKNRSPGPDGFPVEFFIASWCIVGQDVTKAILYFFDSLKLPRIVNVAALCLIPKQKNPSLMQHFRPISCYNVLYKCLSKMLAARLKNVMSRLISPCQTAFIANRTIGDNIFLVQALCKDYHLNSGQARCAIKLDIHKAFDSLNWNFIFSAMQRMGFPDKFTSWVRACVTTSMFSIKLNVCLEGFFKGESGVRQGRPPFTLFVCSGYGGLLCLFEEKYCH